MVIDGAMGTTIQQYKFTEEDFRMEMFKDHPNTQELKGNNDLLVFTQVLCKRRPYATLAAPAHPPPPAPLTTPQLHVYSLHCIHCTPAHLAPLMWPCVVAPAAAQPDTIREIHRRYFAAGADICETNTFSGTVIAQVLGQPSPTVHPFRA